MLLSLPILHHARVNPLLLQRNKPALFIQFPADKSVGAAKLFLLSNLSLCCIWCFGFFSQNSKLVVNRTILPFVISTVGEILTVDVAHIYSFKIPRYLGMTNGSVEDQKTGGRIAFVKGAKSAFLSFIQNNKRRDVA
jgi:hypothetical protein